jgi:hypothetical protein
MTEATNTVTLESLGFNTAPLDVSNRWIDQKIVLAAVPKGGKTTLMAQGGEKTWFLRCEAGFNHVKTFGEDIRDFGDFDKGIEKLLKAHAAGLFKWDTLVIDPATRMMDFMGERIIDLGREKFPNSEINEIGDIGKGTGWFWYKNLVKTTLNRLDPLPCAKVLVFHVHTEEKSDNPKDKTKTYKRDIISASEKLGGPIREWADHIFQIRSGYVGENLVARALVTRGSKILEAGTRSKTLPESIPFTADEAKNYATLRSYFS